MGWEFKEDATCPSLSVGVNIQSRVFYVHMNMVRNSHLSLVIFLTRECYAGYSGVRVFS